MLLDLGKKGRGKEKRESKRERRACCFQREKKGGVDVSRRRWVQGHCNMQKPHMTAIYFKKKKDVILWRGENKGVKKKKEEQHNWESAEERRGKKNGMRTKTARCFRKVVSLYRSKAARMPLNMKKVEHNEPWQLSLEQLKRRKKKKEHFPTNPNTCTPDQPLSRTTWWASHGRKTEVKRVEFIFSGIYKIMSKQRKLQECIYRESCVHWFHSYFLSTRRLSKYSKPRPSLAWRAATGSPPAASPDR